MIGYLNKEAVKLKESYLESKSENNFLCDLTGDCEETEEKRFFSELNGTGSENTNVQTGVTNTNNNTTNNNLDKLDYGNKNRYKNKVGFGPGPSEPLKYCGDNWKEIGTFTCNPENQEVQTITTCLPPEYSNPKYWFWDRSTNTFSHTTGKTCSNDKIKNNGIKCILSDGRSVHHLDTISLYYKNKKDNGSVCRSAQFICNNGKIKLAFSSLRLGVKESDILWEELYTTMQVCENKRYLQLCGANWKEIGNFTCDSQNREIQTITTCLPPGYDDPKYWNWDKSTNTFTHFTGKSCSK